MLILFLGEQQIFFSQFISMHENRFDTYNGTD